MADEPHIEEVKEDPKQSANNSKSKGGGGSPWIPLLLVVILVPGLSYAVGEFILMPKMKKSLEDALGMATFNAAEHVPGSSHEKGAQGTEEIKAYTYTFENVIANLTGSMQTRYIKTSFVIEGKSPDFQKIIEANEAKITDAALTILSGLSVADLEQPGIKSTIRSDLLTAFATVLKKDVVSELYFSEFIVQ